jgi:hypothetical protein
MTDASSTPTTAPAAPVDTDHIVAERRAKLAALGGPAVVVDVCSGKGSFSAALIPEFPNVHVLNYDKVGPDPRYLGWRTPGNASRHAHVSQKKKKCPGWTAEVDSKFKSLLSRL